MNLNKTMMGSPSQYKCVFLILRAALDRAAVLLKMSMGGLRIDNHWGTGGGQRPVTQLIKQVRYTFCMSSVVKQHCW